MPSPRFVNLRRRLLRTAEKCLYWAGVGSAYVRARQHNGALILMYHSVPDEELAPWIDPTFAARPEVFRSQIRFLARHRRPISMRELVEACAAGRALPRGSVVITFDDGYRDNLLTAARILEEFDLPATFFLATGYVDSGEPQWVDRLYVAFKRRSLNALDLTGWNLSSWDHSRQPDVDEAHRKISDTLIVSGWQKRLDLLDDIERQLGPTGTPPRTTLDWDDVRQLARNPRFEIGGHTRHHIDLSTCSEEESTSEVMGCLDDILRETGLQATHFSYPYGRPGDSVRELLAGAGFESAALTEPARPIRREDDVLALSRLYAGLGTTMFRFVTSGAYPDLPKALFGRA